MERRLGEKMQRIRRDVKYLAKPSEDLEKSVERSSLGGIY